MKYPDPRIRVSAFAILACLAVAACGEKAVSSPAVTAGGAASTTSAVATPVLDLGKTKALYDSIVGKEIGDQVGRAELRTDRILIHPGETTPTKVSFKIGGHYKSGILRSFIEALPPEAPATGSGTVGVQFFLDGKSMEHFNVDRNSARTDTLNLTGVDLLTVVVDNGEGKPWFDWFMLGVLDMK
jgi:hypothetical protein